MPIGPRSTSLSDAEIRALKTLLEPVAYSPFLTILAVTGSEIPSATFFACCHDSLTDFDFLKDAHDGLSPVAIQTGGQLSDLQSLPTAGDVQRLNTIIRSAVRLERSIVKAHDIGVPITGLFNSPLPCLTTLRYINLELNVRYGSPAQSLLPFRGLFDELRRFPSCSVLEDVDIIIRVTDMERWTVNKDDWLLLATVFTKSHSLA